MEQEILNQETGLTAEEYFDKGTDAAEQGNWADAIENFNKSISIEPNASTYRKLAMVYAMTKDYDNAIASGNEAIRLDPNNAASYGSLALAYYSKNDYDNAFANYNEAIRLDPNDAQNYCMRGFTYWFKIDYNNACNDFEEAIRRNPNYVIPYKMAGRCYAMKGEINKAIAIWEKGLKIDPANTDIKNLMNNFKSPRNRDKGGGCLNTILFTVAIVLAIHYLLRVI